MINRPSRIIAVAVAAAVLCAFTVHAQQVVTPKTKPAPGAAAAPEGKKKGKENPEAPHGPVDLLRRAYITLSEADHDYKGHRIEAMKKIEAAGKELGEKLMGDGHDHEKQGISDEHLREAEGLLAQAKASLKGKALKHIDAAEKDLKIALKIR